MTNRTALTSDTTAFGNTASIHFRSTGKPTDDGGFLKEFQQTRQVRVGTGDQWPSCPRGAPGGGIRHMIFRYRGWINAGKVRFRRTISKKIVNPRGRCLPLSPFLVVAYRSQHAQGEILGRRYWGLRRCLLHDQGQTWYSMTRVQDWG